jgi:hypothetical protein
MWERKGKKNISPSTDTFVTTCDIMALSADVKKARDFIDIPGPIK